MKILYGVAGQGFGHAMRSKNVIEHLIRKGHVVKVITYGQAYPVLNEKFDCVEITGFHLYYHNNKMSYLRTVMNNLRQVRKLFHDLEVVRKVFLDFKPKVVFSDYETNTAYFAKMFKKPLISLGNHHFITNCKIDFPDVYKKDYLAISAFTKAAAPFADKYFVTSFVDIETKDDKTELVDPILQADVLRTKVTEKKYIMIYLTSEFTDIVSVLKDIKYKFIVYGLNKDQVIGNVTLKKFNRRGFINDLAGCKAVIANAGFSLISEALYFRKPYFALPIKSQFEQTINAIYLKKMGYGDYQHDVSKKGILGFIKKIDKYKDNLKGYTKVNAKSFQKKVDNLLKTYEKM